MMAAPDPLPAQQAGQVAIDHDDIGGVVRSRSGPEAGVWVIAETTGLPTKSAKMVVPDDKGRYVIPDLPRANYSVWVRGYGLVDSPKVRAKPGQQLDLTAVPAPDERAAAHYYPAIYWYTMMKIPPAKDFGGTTDIPKNVTQELWRHRMTNTDCIGCHQLGQESTRTIPAALGEFKSGAEAWMRRIASGQTGEFMMNRSAVQLGGVPFKYFGDWTDRVARGELPRHKPPRPAGIERNVVVTSWEWGTEKTFIHDLISSDRRHPTVNAYGPLYGSPEYSSDDMPILDPKTHKVAFFKMPVADRDAPESFGPPFHASAAAKPTLPSPYWGDEKIWSQRVNNKVWDETGDAAKAQGWAPWVLDTNGNGKVDEWTEPGKEPEVGKDMRIAGSGPYAVMPHPTDGSVWYTFNVFVGPPGFLRFDPKTRLSEFYAVPKEGIGVRGGDIDKNGVVWGSGSNGSLISFDRRIDDPNAGWKGRGLWSTNGDRTPWLMEGGKGSKPRAVHIQVRPDPLAK